MLTCGYSGLKPERKQQYTANPLPYNFILQAPKLEAPVSSLERAATHHHVMQMHQPMLM